MYLTICLNAHIFETRFPEFELEGRPLFLYIGNATNKEESMIYYLFLILKFEICVKQWLKFKMENIVETEYISIF